MCSKGRIYPAKDTSLLADHLGIGDFTIVGYSGGGPYALVSALALADRIHSVGIVAGVGPLDTPQRIAGMPEEHRPAYEAAASGPRGFVPIMEAVVAIANSGLETFRASQKDSLPRPDLDAVEAMPELAPFLANMLQESAACGAEGCAYDLWLLTQPWGFDPASIKTPVRFFHGDLDRNVPLDHARELNGLIKQSTLVVWLGEAHLVGYTRLSDVLAAL